MFLQGAKHRLGSVSKKQPYILVKINNMWLVFTALWRKIKKMVKIKQKNDNPFPKMRYCRTCRNPI